MPVKSNPNHIRGSTWNPAPIGASASRGTIVDAPALCDHVHPLGTEGTVTMNGATPVAVSNANVTATSHILLTYNSGSAQGSAPNVVSKTAGSGFSVQSVAGDTATYQYCIIH
jgi:hypothetical protein